MTTHLAWYARLVWALIPGALAADLLYLYAQGAWVEPVAWIRTFELIVLCGIIALSLLRGWQSSASPFRRQAGHASPSEITSGGKL